MFPLTSIQTKTGAPIMLVIAPIGRIAPGRIADEIKSLNDSKIAPQIAEDGIKYL